MLSSSRTGSSVRGIPTNLGPSGSSPSKGHSSLKSIPPEKLAEMLQNRWKQFGHHMASSHSQQEQFPLLIGTDESERSMKLMWEGGMLNESLVVGRFADQCGHMDVASSLYEREILEKNPDLSSAIIATCRELVGDSSECVPAVHLSLCEVGGPPRVDQGLKAELEAGSGGRVLLPVASEGRSVLVRFSIVTPMIQEARSDASIEKWLLSGTYTPTRHRVPVSDPSNIYERGVYQLIRGTDVSWMIRDAQKRHDESEYRNRMDCAMARGARERAELASLSPMERSARERHSLFASHQAAKPSSGRGSLDWIL
jgi:hypothetical protein